MALSIVIMRRIIFLACLLCSLAPLATEASLPFQPQFHIRPVKNWLNDPNGMMYWEGQYHFFHQYNPNGSSWGNMSWCHYVSSDLVYWRELPVALVPDQSYDGLGIWSGSTTIVPGVGPVIFYTCIGNDNQQRQCIATPTDLDDPDLIKWTKYPGNPVIDPAHHPAFNWGRDPMTAWQDVKDRRWYLAYGTSSPEGGAAILFASDPDSIFTGWNVVDYLHTNSYSGFWECPDKAVLPSDSDVQGWTYLKASTNGADFFSLGQYLNDTQTWTPGCTGTSGSDSVELSAAMSSICSLNPNTGLGANDVCQWSQLIVGGPFYASKSFFDPIGGGGRQILYGWVKEQDDNTPDRGWQGVQSLPRTLWASSTANRVCQGVLEDLQVLRNQTNMQQYNSISFQDNSEFTLNEYSGAFASEPMQGSFGDMQELDLEVVFQPFNSSTVAASGQPQFLHLGLSVLSSPDGSTQTQVGLYSRSDAAWGMVSVSMEGMEYNSTQNVRDAEDCMSLCIQDGSVCKAWTFISISGSPSLCSLQSGVPFPQTANSSFISGVIVPDVNDPVNYLGHCLDEQTARTRAQQVQRRAIAGPAQAQIVWLYINRTLSAGDSSNSTTTSLLSSQSFVLDPTVDVDPLTGNWMVQVRTFVDVSIIEALESSGRAAVIARAYPTEPQARFTTLFAYPVNGYTDQLPAASVNYLQVFNLSSIFLTSATKSDPPSAAEDITIALS